MGLLVLRSADHRRVPWKNGLGVTYEVAQSEGVWRLSFAEVDRPGPFSTFPGVDRIITLAVGAQLALTVDGVVQVLRPFEPFAFAGEAEVAADPSAATVNFNVMTQRGRAAAEVICLQITGVAGVRDADFLAVLAGAVEVDGVELGRLDVVQGWSGVARLTGDAVVAVVRITE
ncbi:HutD family protein [Kribbella antibiotica]|uniref:HutD family protein n=1 Tax=Kribbella antibiotica TaxID=190195 RepID=A0A4R4ZVU8_9ACTN|nr:HutD family protein [Kribbella antibiotica]TDD61272.1 HutD family protein [Kribbella antibiotica]